MIATDKQNGKSMTKSKKKSNSLKGVASLVSKSSPSSSIALNVSSQSLMDFFLASSPSSMSAASKTSSLLSSTSKIKKRLVLDSPQTKKKANCMDILKNQELKLAAYEVDWFNSTSTKNECLKHTSKNNHTQVAIYQGIYWDSTIKNKKIQPSTMTTPSSFYDINIHKYEFATESVWRHKEQSKTTKRLSFVYTCDTVNDRNGKQGVIEAIKFFFMLMEKCKINPIGSLVLEYLKGHALALYEYLLKKKPNEELVTENLADDIDKHFHAGFALHWDDCLNHWMVD